MGDFALHNSPVDSIARSAGTDFAGDATRFIGLLARTDLNRTFNFMSNELQLYAQKVVPFERKYAQGEWISEFVSSANSELRKLGFPAGQLTQDKNQKGTYHIRFEGSKVEVFFDLTSYDICVRGDKKMPSEEHTHFASEQCKQ